jgi:uncharacterized protein YlbG (UPF0298 family)
MLNTAMINMKTDFFLPIRLDEMEQVKLMNRTDTKYWFHSDRLYEILQEIKNYYYLLEIEGESKLPYTTTYYDTLKNEMFTEHHNGKLNRYKVRRRSYVTSNISFLEVKFKSNKGRTIKKRILSEFGNITFTERENEFLSKYIPFGLEDLQPSLINSFSRLTLVNKNFKERCTIDFNLQFEKADKMIALNNLVIVEIKAEGKSAISPLAYALREQRIKISGFSKYCVGRTLTDSSLKRNAFKGKIRSIEKIIQSNINLYHIN